LDAVSFDDLAAGCVVDGGRDFARDVLDEGAAAPDVEGLGAVADGEDWFLEIEGVLDEEFVDGGAGWVGSSTLGDGLPPVFLGIDVGAGAGEEDSVAGGEDFGDPFLGFVEGDGDGDESGGVEGVEVLGQAALIVGDGVGDVGGAGGFGDSDVEGVHVRTIIGRECGCGV